MFYSTLILNKKNLIKNFENIKAKKVCAMVKANAYGHDVKFVCDALQNKAEYFGVANLFEALEIRAFNKENKVLIVGVCQNYLSAIENNISFTIQSMEEFDNLLKITEKYHFLLEKSENIGNFHIKINSGMNRLGIKNILEFKKLIKKYLNFKYKFLLNFEGIFTHFSTADCDKFFLKKQAQEFKKFLNQIPPILSPLVHIGGGAAECILSEFPGAMLRVGLGLFLPNQVMTVESEVVSTVCVKSGERVGYSNGFIAKKDCRIAVVPLGYADGVSRKLGGRASVKIGGKNFLLVGNVCMDMFFVLVDKNVMVGDKVVVFDSAKKWSKICGTIEYEIFTNINSSRMDVLVK